VSEGDRSTRKALNMSRCVTACDSEAVRRLIMRTRHRPHALPVSLFIPQRFISTNLLVLGGGGGAGKSGVKEQNCQLRSTRGLYIFYD